MRPRHRVVVLDASDVPSESRFWADLLEGEVVVPSWSDGRWHSVHLEGQPVLGVQHAPDHVPPTWPDPEVRQQVHLDLEVDDPAAAEAEVLAKGGRLLLAADDLGAAAGFRACADPAGHPFCLTWGAQA
ncbi:VOC family protein [Streptomyces sp. NP160]|uniref:VOC family protein n=1 Tax=Streptomyces sp. NP160 TaxID=2586637 RepID=UPI00111B1BA3|nr:VOC family protein [Streptomyces sp. NP160]TNM64417.1 VOC family protein [Streptomyces sp. NP160]